MLIISPTNWKLKNTKKTTKFELTRELAKKKKIDNFIEDIHLQKNTYELQLVLGTDFF